MKKLKKIILSSLLLFLVIFQSCSEDDTKNVTINTIDVNASLSSSAIITAEGFEVPYSLNLDQTFTSDATVRIQYRLNDLRTITEDVIIEAGSSSASGSIFTPAPDDLDAGFYGHADYITMKAIGIVLDEGVVGEAYNMISNEVFLSLYDRVQWPYGDGVVSGRMTTLFDWTRPSTNDLDMLMFNASTFDLVENAESGTRWETDIFNDTHPDGDYFVAFPVFSTDGDDIDWRLFFVHPDQVTIETFSGTIVSPTAGDFLFPIINFTKSTDTDGNVSYTFSQP